MNRYGKISVIALLSVVFLFYAVSASAQPFGLASPEQQEASQHQMLSSENGRFVFGQVSGSDKDKFMLDTSTGRLWRIGESGKMGMFLLPVLYRSTEDEYTIVPED